MLCGQKTRTSDFDSHFLNSISFLVDNFDETGINKNMKVLGLGHTVSGSKLLSQAPPFLSGDRRCVWSRDFVNSNHFFLFCLFPLVVGSTVHDGFLFLLFDPGFATIFGAFACFFHDRFLCVIHYSSSFVQWVIVFEFFLQLIACRSSVLLTNPV